MKSMGTILVSNWAETFNLFIARAIKNCSLMKSLKVCFILLLSLNVNSLSQHLENRRSYQNSHNETIIISLLLQGTTNILLLLKTSLARILLR